MFKRWAIQANGMVVLERNSRANWTFPRSALPRALRSASLQRILWRPSTTSRSACAPSASCTAPQVALSGYSYFVSANSRRVELGLPQFDLPPAEPTFSPNPVAELAVTNLEGTINLKLRVPSLPAQYTLVQGAAPVSTGIRCVQHYPFLGLLPPPTDGWSDITELYVARYGVPPVGTVVFIRTCQHIDGSTDVPKVTSTRVPAPTP
jgi:hypothetical protein